MQEERRAVGNCYVQSGPGWVVGSRGTGRAAFCIRVQRGGKARQQPRRRTGRDQSKGAGGRGGSGETEAWSNVRGWYGTLAGTGLALPWQWVGACHSLWSCPVHKALRNPSCLQPHASMIPAASQELAVKSLSSGLELGLSAAAFPKPVRHVAFAVTAMALSL